MSISTDAPTKGTASIVFVDCEISAGAGPSSGGGVHAHAHRRWEVVIAGKRIKTVDVHAHCIVPDAAKLINHPLEAPALLWSNVGDRLTHMDKSGVDVEALSINPFWYRAERDAAEQLIKVQNETLVEFCPVIPIVSSASRRWRCSFRTSLRSKSSTRSRNSGFAASALPAALPARNWRTQNSTRSGPSARNWAC